jgi:hypothetical protein
VDFIEYRVVPLTGSTATEPEACDERYADFWGLYGLDDDGWLYAIGDFSSKEEAEYIKGRLTPPR